MSEEQNGNFTILLSKLEKQKQNANFNILKKISYKNQGLFIKKEDFENYSDIIKSNIDSNHHIYYNKYLVDLIKEKSIFLLLLLLLSLEWIIRKRQGTN